MRVFTVAAAESNDSVVLQQLTDVALHYERILASKKDGGACEQAGGGALGKFFSLVAHFII